MPYNTRRKSLSLESLGIHVPNSSRASNRSPPSSLPTPVSVSDEKSQPPPKKVKRSHTMSSSGSVSSPSPPRKSTIKFADAALTSRAAENTPPPSPGGLGRQNKIDTEGINDDIVVGVIEQLEETGNRPHLLKELAAVLSTRLQSVESSANPAAIISSRLANYLRRTWTALSPCPLDKVLVGTHPKRVYYFLTTTPHQEIPQHPDSGPAVTSRIISPSLSGATDEEIEDRASRARAQMSPSPEVDLPDLDLGNDGMNTPFSEHGSHPPISNNMAHNRRAASPPLERVEREFSGLASTLQQRSRCQSESMEDVTIEPVVEDPAPSIEIDETEESAARKNSETAAVLFGSSVESLALATAATVMSSPLVKPQSLPSVLSQKRPFEAEVKMLDEARWDLYETNVELDELDEMFGDY
ncbi:hypothetical protein EJ05DRAFT_247999 [Pseudovirgaria hyperparasitica]|uniref:GDS1 winged helix domain-containing protein n=1 Tax=Pseudovirgaria hyperparasitica TaxID=470096 RepID=A0A6A6WFY0_9PEZI|nr:uncharacterized protein EJ05DRAFT_247999 [Pseudovirgaria hyperparasitica]KAF2760964.1 hypothetical protein EJ05DRAFT_247999 [Pseudovirgaria hyperparasitica]